MSRHKTLQMITENVEAHPAVRAWSRLRAGLPHPEAIELLRKENSKTPVVRLVRIGRDGTSVIAKKAGFARAMVEKTMYENATPRLSLTTLRYFGCVEAEDNSFWIFTEDAGDSPFSFKDDRHRALAVQWLAALHTSVPKRDCFPDRGIGYYRARMTSAREKIMVNMDNTAVRGDDRALLQTTASRLDLIAQRWERIRDLNAQMPQGLIHGDFKARNLRVRDDADRSALLVFDWEESGWGLPGIDMWRLDPGSYWLNVREHWPGMTRENVLCLSSLGKLLWCLKAIDWEAGNLASVWVEETMDCLRVYEDHVRDAVQHIGLHH